MEAFGLSEKRWPSIIEEEQRIINEELHKPLKSCNDHKQFGFLEANRSNKNVKFLINHFENLAKQENSENVFNCAESKTFNRKAEAFKKIFNDLENPPGAENYDDEFQKEANYSKCKHEVINEMSKTYESSIEVLPEEETSSTWLFSIIFGMFTCY